MWKEFRDFIAKGNLVQLAVAFVMGVAFGTVVSSFVNDLVMPIIGKLIGNVDFANLYVNLSGTEYASAAAAREAGAAAIYYGAFVNTLINFLVVALTIFFIVKAYMRSQKPKAASAPTAKLCPHCKTDIPLAATRCPHCTSQLN
jgi:large conductance mechanosensitive channel